MEIDFEGARVEALALDFSLRIDCDPAGLVQIDVPVVFGRGDSSQTVPVGDVDLTANPVFNGLVGQRITSASATSDGVLTIVFETGARLVAKLDPDYESWTVRTPAGAIFSAGPGADTRHLPKSGSLLWLEEHPQGE